MPATVRWSSSASPIGRVGSSSRRRRRKRVLVELRARGCPGPRPAIRWSKRVRDSVISSSTGPSNCTTSRSPRAQHEPRRARGRGQRGRARARATSRSCAGASGSSGRPRSAGTGACRARRPRVTARPASRSGQRSRPKRGCGVRELVGHVAREHGPDAVGGVVDRVALGHASEGTASGIGLNSAAASADDRGMAPRLSLLGKFVVLSLLATVLLAVVVGSVLHERDRAPRARQRRAARRASSATSRSRRGCTETQLEGDLPRAGPRRPRRGRRAGLDRRRRGPPRQPLHARRAADLLRRPRADRPSVTPQRERARRVRGHDALPDRAVAATTTATDRRDDARGLHAAAARRTARVAACSRSTWTTRRRRRRSARDSRALYLLLGLGLGAALALALHARRAAPRASCATRRCTTRSPGLPNRTSLYRARRARDRAACAASAGSPACC